jgi:hypothetical protein
MQHLGRQETLQWFDRRARIGEQPGRRPDRSLDLGIDREARAGIEVEADPEAPGLERCGEPVNVGRGRLMWSRGSGRASSRSSIAESATLRVIGPTTRPRNGGSTGTRPETGLQGEDAVPAAGQAHRAADVGAEMQGP